MPWPTNLPVLVCPDTLRNRQAIEEAGPWETEKRFLPDVTGNCWFVARQDTEYRVQRCRKESNL